ncbi:nucleotide exchange factor GrpE [Paenibacillus sp. N1-5-1-14]|nr:nucleotide exchange factor GrpE [Paenibacillus radicibacter]MCR8645709.1 nucleotide exchange factor GrpE [Paenibacillus radicibacter]
MSAQEKDVNALDANLDENPEVVGDETSTYTQEGDASSLEQQTETAQTVENEETVESNSEIEQLRALADENYQKYLRTQADFDNFRRRARLEKEDFAKYASSKVIEGLIPVLDNMERAIAASKESQDLDGLVKGIDMVFRQFDSVLLQEGLTAIESVGQPFNPDFHQAIMQVESDEYEEGYVVEEVQKGYKLKDKVIRPAMVKVSM